MSIISFGGINKSLLYIILAGVLKVLNQYTYGFIYIGCLYQMNFYRILYNAIIDSNKTDFPRHRVFDTLFSYIGLIILGSILVSLIIESHGRYKYSIEPLWCIVACQIFDSDLHDKFVFGLRNKCNRLKVRI